MVKKEVRILGLSAPRASAKRIPIIGVVFRGNLWLDGIIMCVLEVGRRNNLSTLVRAIVDSKQYSQIRAVILSREQLFPGISIRALADRVGLPVISMTKEKVRNERSGAALRNLHRIKTTSGRLVSVSDAGMDDMINEVFTVGCARNSSIPEAVRVADLIVKSVFNSVFSERPSNA